jgi:anti-anti-sigma factor
MQEQSFLALQRGALRTQGLNFDANHSPKFSSTDGVITIMSTAIFTPRPADRRGARTAKFATRWLQPSVAVITAHGDLDACNAQEFVDYALRDAERTDRMALDLSGVEFFGTAGFSALHTLNVRCAGACIEWVLVPSDSVSRLMRICDPDSALPIAATMPAALMRLRADQRRLLKLVSEPS